VYIRVKKYQSDGSSVEQTYDPSTIKIEPINPQFSTIKQFDKSSIDENIEDLYNFIQEIGPDLDDNLYIEVYNSTDARTENLTTKDRNGVLKSLDILKGELQQTHNEIN
jgi:hypothetical protein